MPLPAPTDVIDVAIAAGDAMRADLRRRGVDPASRERLLRALENGVASMLAAREFNRADVKVARPLRDEAAWRRYVAECRRRLEGSELDRPPEPPRLTSSRLLAELDEARAAAG
jgi:hypothetical protein